MRRSLRSTGIIIGVYITMVMAGPEVSFSGYLDADVWGDLEGSYYANSELDLGMLYLFL